MKKQTYEESMKTLEDIVAKLENGDVPLDESLKLFEEGTKLAAFCTKALDTAEQKILSLSQAEAEAAEEKE